MSINLIVGLIVLCVFLIVISYPIEEWVVSRLDRSNEDDES